MVKFFVLDVLLRRVGTASSGPAPDASSLVNCGHEHYGATKRWRAGEERPRRFGGGNGVAVHETTYARTVQQ
jgi:hypothetical protein